MDWLILLVSIHLQCLKGYDESFKYEQLHMFGLGRPIVSLFFGFTPRVSSKALQFFLSFTQNRRRDNGYAYPEELSTKVMAYVRSPYRNIYQGSRMKRDKRVYNKRFHYPPKPRGHHVYCEGVFDCILTHMSIETNDSIPTILRGGVGYKHFSVVIKANYGEELSGRVRAYCVNVTQDT